MKLATSVSANNLVISWPASATGFALEGTGVLGTGANWTAVNFVSVTVGNQLQATVPLQGSKQFFRLRAPVLSSGRAPFLRPAKWEPPVVQQVFSLMR